MTIDELYRFIQLIANKEQRGFIKPSEFNLLAQQAQLDLIHDRLARYQTEAEKNKKASSALIQNHSVLDDIRTVVKKTQLVYSNPLDNSAAVGEDQYDSSINGVFLYPVNEYDENVGTETGEYLHFLRLYQAKEQSHVEPFNQETVPGGYPPQEVLDKTHALTGDIDVVNHDQISHRLKSKLCPVDSNNMVAVMMDNGFEIYTFDSSLNEVAELKEELNNQGHTIHQHIWLVYVAKPPAPFCGYNIINNTYVYSPSNANTRQLTLPSKTHREIAQRMLSYIGISLRDNEPMAYAEAKVKDKSITR